MGSWLGNGCQSLPKTFCKSGLKMLCYKWKAQQSSLTASTQPLEKECDRSGDKECLTFVVTHLIPRECAPSFCASFQWPMAGIHLHGFKTHGIQYLLLAGPSVSDRMCSTAGQKVWLTFGVLGAKAQKAKRKTGPKFLISNEKNKYQSHSIEKLI